MWIDFHQASQSFRTPWRTARSCRFAAWHLAVPFSERSATMVRRASCPLVLGLVSSMVSRTDEVKGETHTKSRTLTSPLVEKISVRSSTRASRLLHPCAVGLGVGSYFKVVSMLYLKLQLLHAFSFHFEVAVLSRSPFVLS